MSQSRTYTPTAFNKWDLNNGSSPLANFVKSIHPQISDNVLLYIDEHCFHRSIRKGAHLLKEGDFAGHIYFIVKGAFRSYRKQGSAEINTWLKLENEMLTFLRELYLEQPINENIQAIEDSELIGLTFQDLQYLYEHHQDMNAAGRKLLEKHYVEAGERDYLGRITNATIKYSFFLSTQPQIASRVPLKYIASYLGMRIETLSRIRSKLPNNSSKRKKKIQPSSDEASQTIAVP